MTKLRSINWIYILARVITYGFMAAAARISYQHIVDLSTWLGCSPTEARFAPVFVDGLAMLGWLGRRRRFAEHTRRIGFRLMLGAGLVSLACNIAAGHTNGSRAFGALVVLGFAVAEWYADHLAPAPAKQSTPVSDETRARRSDAARRGAETKRRNADAAAKAEVKATRERRRAERELEEAFRMPAAPVSPAPAGA